MTIKYINTSIKLCLTIMLLGVFSNSFSQDSEFETRKIYIRKTINIVKIEDEKNRILREKYDKHYCQFTSPSYEKKSRVTNYPPCKKFSWLQPKWTIFAFPDKSKETKYYLDKLEIIDCDSAIITYYTNPDSTKITCSWKINEEDSTLSIFYLDILKKPIELTYKYELSIASFINKHDLESKNPKPIIVFMDINLSVPEKSINYTLTWGSRLENHNYFPEICRTINDTTNKWVSDFDDKEGFKHKINIINCTEIEIIHDNPWKKNKKTNLKASFLKGKRHIEIVRNPQNINDNYFYHLTSMEFVGDKLIIKSRDKSFSYSRINQ